MSDRLRQDYDLCGWRISISAPEGVNNFFLVEDIDVVLSQQTDNGEFGRMALSYHPSEESPND